MDDKKAPFVSTGISYLPETKGAVPSALPLCFALLWGRCSTDTAVISRRLITDGPPFPITHPFFHRNRS